MEIIFASRNHNKFNDIITFGRDVGVSLISVDQLFVRQPELGPPPEVDEPEKYYFGNAQIKVSEYLKWCGLPCLADDSGVEVEALDGAPGVDSAIFAATDSIVRPTAEQNNQKLLNLMKGVKNRKARFVSWMVFASGKGQYLVSQGSIEGEIAEEPYGKGGWGYEPIFILAGTGLTLSALRDQGTAPFNHRAFAAKRIFDLISKFKNNTTVEDENQLRQDGVDGVPRRARSIQHC